jgi:diguanylate cyclase (GGDEF)-like protein/PAS domain S-box-containing protein
VGSQDDSANESVILDLEANEFLFHEDESGDSMFIVLSGKCIVTRKGITIIDRIPGEYFGEMALIDHKPRSASVKTKVKTRLLKITREQYVSKISAHSPSLCALLKNLSLRSRHDISVLIENLLELKKQESLSNRLNHILDKTSNEVYAFDCDDHKFKLSNSTALKNLGYEEEEFEMIYPQDIWRDFTQDKLEELIAPLRSGVQGFIKFQTNHLRKDGTSYPVEIRLQFLSDGIPPLYLAIVNDDTYRKNMEETLEGLIFKDTLTGLPNEILFRDRLDLAMAEAKRETKKIAVLTLGMDNFSRINNSLGRETGDALLVKVAQRLSQSLRKNETLARIGGDEFSIILQSFSHDKFAIKVAQKILEIFKIPFKIDGHNIFISFSIGIAFYPDDGVFTYELMENSSSALNLAKKQGKDTFQHFHPALLLIASEMMMVETGLREALEQDNLVLFYQPKIDLNTDRVLGLEALIRWNKPGVGIITPGEFIAVAEENHLIIPIGEWVIKTACLQIKEWEKEGVPFGSIAINMSGVQFKQADVVSMVSKTLEETKVDPKYLELELTESIIMENSEAAIAKLHQLRDLGVSLSIDDFGTGYSSLSYLKNMPIDNLKIDQSFVNEVHKPCNEAIVKAVSFLGQSLGLKTIAEGVETTQQKEFLKLISCDLIQGYLISRPLPSEEMPALIEKINMGHVSNC